jgi:hypothetical protein
MARSRWPLSWCAQARSAWALATSCAVPPLAIAAEQAAMRWSEVELSALHSAGSTACADAEAKED